MLITGVYGQITPRKETAIINASVDREFKAEIRPVNFQGKTGLLQIPTPLGWLHDQVHLHNSEEAPGI